MAEVQELDLDGDVCLLVGAEGSQQLRIRASKALLQYSSSYFRALFGPRFSEGVSAEAGKDIRLADDDPEAFALLCKILHMRYRSQSPPACDELVALGVIADKYGCVESLRLSLDFLFSGPVYDEPDLSKAIVASYLLDQPKLFKRLTGELMLEYASSFTALAKSDHGRMLPTLLWLELEAMRNELTKSVASMLMEVTQYPCCGVDDPCRDATQWCQTVAAELSDKGFDTTFQQSLSAIYMTMIRINLPAPPSTNCSRDESKPHRVCMSNRQFQSKVDDIFVGRGLCLDCIRTEDKTKKEERCRVAHD